MLQPMVTADRTNEARSVSWPLSRRSLGGACLAHLLNDGYTDQLYALLPAWQSEYGLSYARLTLVRALYSGTMGVMQVPANKFTARLSPRVALALATFIAAAGYLIVALPVGFPGLGVRLVIAGVGSSIQHPRASILVTTSYGKNLRGPLGIYNFAGDLGKVTFPAAVALLLPFIAWRPVVGLMALIGLAIAFALLPLVPPRPPKNKPLTRGRMVAASICSLRSARSIQQRAWGICFSFRSSFTPKAATRQPSASALPCSSPAGPWAKPVAAGLGSILA
jgi:hypothetical protein